MSTAFPLCCEPRHEGAVRDLIEGCVRFVRGRLRPPTLVAVVLTGSYARGEGSILALPDRLKVLGDIEFFVVVATGADYRRLRGQMAAWGPAASAALGGERIHVDIEFGPVPLDYLQRRASPSIFVHDLRNHGKVLWGPADLLESMPPFGPEAIPREDALRLLFNRTIEQLDAHDRLDGLEGEAVLDVAYQRLKSVVDLAGSALAFTGGHRASYRERPAALARLVRETPSLARRLPARFQRELADATLTKLAPDVTDLVPEGVGAAEQRAAVRARIVATVPALVGLLHWELEQFVDRSGDLADLLEAYRRTPTLSRRIRDWTKLVMLPVRAPLPIDPLRAARLFASSTPRTLLYAAGALAYRDLAAARPDLDAVARLLPVGRRACPRDPEAQRRAVVALWRWCLRNS